MRSRFNHCSLSKAYCRWLSDLESGFRLVLDASNIEPDRLVCYKRNASEEQKRCGLWTSIRQPQMQMPLEDSSTGPASYVEMKAGPGAVF